MLTYISIGFFGNRIYAGQNFGVDHNMLLIGGALAHRKSRYLRVGSRCVAGSRRTFALSPQSVAIMSGSVNRRGCRWARGFSEDGGGPTRGLQQSPEYPADAHSGVGCNQGFFTGAYNELQEPGETFVGLHRSLVKWT